jgi:hypothetical protein
MGNASSVGRVFAKALGWFITASLVSLLLGMVLANALQPGHNLGLPLPDIGASANLATSKFTMKDFVTHLVPEVVRGGNGPERDPPDRGLLDVLRAWRARRPAPRPRPWWRPIDELSHIMLTITGYVMKLAPVAVLAAMAATVAVNGLEILLKFAVFMGDFYLGLFILVGAPHRRGLPRPGDAHPAPALPHQGSVHGVFRHRELGGGLSQDPGRARPLRSQAQDLELRDADGLFLQPRRLDDVLHLRDALHRAGVRHRAVDGNADHDAADPHAHFQGDGGRAASVARVIAATLNQFNIPEAGLLLILGIDTFLDMGRSATNAIGNSIATAAVAKWEGELLSPEEASVLTAELDLAREAAPA